MKIQNPDSILNLRKELGISTIEQIPNMNVKPDCQPVLDMGQKISNVVKYVNKTTTGSLTSLTIPADKNFYLTSIQLTVEQSALCDQVVVYLAGTTENNEIIRLCTINTPPLVLGTWNQSVSFPFPLKLKAGTTVYLVCSFTAGTQVSTTIFTGYLQ